MDSIKNEHMIWALGEQTNGNFVLIIGITDQGIELLKADKKTLLVNPPKPFNKLTNVIIFHEADKATLKQRFKETGLPIHETDLRNL